jgi:GT2 family glycosyltransferase
MSSIIKSKVIVIPVHNQLAYLARCVNSVIEKTSAYKLIIVDDGSTDGKTSMFIKTLGEQKNIIALENRNALGFSAACNKGIQYALDNFDFNCLCLLNSDAEVVTENWFDKVEQHFLTGEKIGVAGVMSDNAMTQTITNPKYLETIDSKPSVYSTLIHGFCYFVSKELIEKIGLLDNEIFPDYGSEDDYSLKSVSNGFQNIVVGSVFVRHNNETSYTHEVRERHIKVSLPALQKRWGRNYVGKVVQQAISVGKYLNSI